MLSPLESSILAGLRANRGSRISFASDLEEMLDEEYNFPTDEGFVPALEFLLRTYRGKPKGVIIKGKLTASSHKRISQVGKRRYAQYMVKICKKMIAIYMGRDKPIFKTPAATVVTIDLKEASYKFEFGETRKKVAKNFFCLY